MTKLENYPPGYSEAEAKRLLEPRRSASWNKARSPIKGDSRVRATANFD
jgi:hypothetical protein